MTGRERTRGHGGTERRAPSPRSPLPRARLRPWLCASAVLVACAGPARDARREHIVVARGATFAAVTDSLVAHGIVTSPRAFRFATRFLGAVWPKLRGVDRRLRPGRYEFPVGERWTVVLSALASGRTDDELFTVPEGSTLAEMAGGAARVLHMDSSAVVSVARDPAFRSRLGIPLERTDVEGYLFPETYRVAFDAQPQQLVAQMVRQFLTVWDTAWDRLARDSLGMTRHEVVTLASIVEAEAHRNSERATIAGVYLNRLRGRRPMRLEADPTVIYALGRPVRRVLYRDLRVDSPYNTYLHFGLPPGPINSPGRASILAALRPARHRFLFFVARPDGSHMFSRTAGEHMDSVAVARRLRAEADAARAAAGAPALPTR